MDKYQKKQDAILAIAAQVFNARGVKGATLADVAAPLGLTTGSLGYYYRKKDDLALACMKQTFRAQDEVLAQAEAESELPRRIARLFEAETDLLSAIARGERSELMHFNDMKALGEPQAKQAGELYVAMWRRVRALLEGGKEFAALSRHELNARSTLILATLAWCRRCVRPYEPDSYRWVAAQMAGIVLEGLTAGGRSNVPMKAESVGRLRSIGPDDRKIEDFLKAATEAINDSGFAGASIDSISSRLQQTKGSFYYHIDTKDDVIMRCFERTFDVISNALDEAESSQASGQNELWHAGLLLCAFQLSAEGPLLRLRATTALPLASEQERVRLNLRRILQRISILIVQGMQDGSLRPVEPRIAAEMVCAVIDSAGGLRGWVPQADESNVATLLLQPLFRGIAASA